MIGYGPTNEKEGVLTVIDSNIQQISECNTFYTVNENDPDYLTIKNNLPQKFNGGSVFCAINYASDHGTCEGDSGGAALLFKGRFNEQVGVVHGNIKNCDGSRFPDIFVRLDNKAVFEWIQKVTSDAIKQSGTDL